MTVSRSSVSRRRLLLKPRNWIRSNLLLTSAWIACSLHCPAGAQLSQPFNNSLQPAVLSNSSGQSLFPSAVNQIAQSPPPQFIPTDVTPFPIAGERSTFAPGYKFRLFQKLPSRMWFNSSSEVSQRYESNVFFTYSHPKSDYVFRVAPNVTLGYNVLKNSSVYCNWFLIKDQFAQHPHELNFPTTQSLSAGARHDATIGQKTTVQLDFQARELWQTSHLHQFDFIPALNITHVVNPNNIFFGSVLLQMRGREYFSAPNRELDPFYTLGYVHRTGTWSFMLNDTLVNNWRTPPFRGSIPQQGNAIMIADFEISHPLVRSLPGLVAFVRAEPIYNWSSHKAAGLSGFDFRLYGGLRFTMNKPSYFSAIEKLREQILESESNKQPPEISKSKRTQAQRTTYALPPPPIPPPWEEPMKTFIHQQGNNSDAHAPDTKRQPCQTGKSTLPDENFHEVTQS